MGAQTSVALGVTVDHACLHRLGSIPSAPTKGTSMKTKLKRTARIRITGSWQKGYAPDF
jgi:hypothetical protein